MEGLRRDSEMVGGIVFFGRMLDKIRLHGAGKLPADYNLGKGFDDRMCRFLGVKYDTVIPVALREKDDGKVLEWCFSNGRKPTEFEVEMFNAFLSKRGWRDNRSDWIAENKAKMGLANRDDIQTAFDIHDADEGRL